MLEDNDRNCDCNNNIGNNTCCEMKEKPNVPMYSFNFTNISAEEDTCEDKKELKCKMLNDIRCLSFAIVELGEYLDTHPDDMRAIALHREYANKLHDLKDKYQRMFGPLSIYFPCNKWRWLEEPWPSFALEEIITSITYLLICNILKFFKNARSARKFLEIV